MSLEALQKDAMAKKARWQLLAAVNQLCGKQSAEFEYIFATDPEKNTVGKKKRWRIDLFFPQHKIAVELEGINFKGKSRHRTAKGYMEDMVKYNHITLYGFRLLRFPTHEVAENPYVAANVISRLIKQQQPK